VAGANKKKEKRTYRQRKAARGRWDLGYKFVTLPTIPTNSACIDPPNSDLV
jgi:hypothetical protein